MHFDPAAVGVYLSAAGLALAMAAGIARQLQLIAVLSTRIEELHAEIMRHCAREERMLADIRERLTYLERQHDGAGKG